MIQWAGSGFLSKSQVHQTQKAEWSRTGRTHRQRQAVENFEDARGARTKKTERPFGGGFASRSSYRPVQKADKSLIKKAGEALRKPKKFRGAQAAPMDVDKINAALEVARTAQS